MAYQFDAKKGEITISGWEKGIAASPHLGIANLQNVNIYTEAGEVMCNFARASQTSAASYSATISPLDANNVQINSAIFAGNWITVSSSTITGLSNGTYYVLVAASGFINLKLSATYKGAAITGFGATGTAHAVIAYPMGKPIARATEQYFDSSFVIQYRYYILDNSGYVWVYDTGDPNTGGTSSTNGLTWANIDPANPATGATGIAIYNGWLHVFLPHELWVKETSQLGINVNSTTGAVGYSTGVQVFNSSVGSLNKHYGFVGHQSTLYITDSNFLVSIFASTTANNPAVANSWSYGTVTSNGSNPSTLTITDLYGGAQPYDGMPVTFTSSKGTNDVTAWGLTSRTVYFVVSSSSSANTFQVATTIGGGGIQITGGSGTLYFNTYDPTSKSGGNATYVYSPQALTLPQNEIAQAIAELQNNLLVGTQTSTVYIWGQAQALPDDFILLPEQNTASLITVNNVAYAFAGSKGNVYVTNGSIASVAFTIPDYVTGMIEPYYAWGDAMYVRGRIFFGVQQLSGTSNIGGVWSFIPTQNFYMGADVPGQGIALRLENQNSYGTYAGVATVLIAAVNQQAQGVQYWAGWDSGSSTYGVDFSGTAPTTQAIVETDIIPVGNYTDRANFAGIEYKLAAPLVVGESIQLFYRTNLSFSSWVQVAAADSTSTIPSPFLSNRLKVPFANIQWIQFQVKMLSTSPASSASFVRLSALLLYRSP